MLFGILHAITTYVRREKVDVDLKAYKTQEDWLAFFIKIGDAARFILTHTVANPVLWQDLAATFFAKVFPPVSSTSSIDYSRWINSLVAFAKEKNIASPCAMTMADADSLAERLSMHKVAPARRFRFYRRVWRTIGLDDSIWNAPNSLVHAMSEHYRRLSGEELAALIALARSKDPDAADMIEIGYWTGLRLSDVVQLERSEVCLETESLFIVPNKVRLRKPYPLAIPLAGGALSAVRRRMTALYDDTYLFSDICRHRPSRRMTKLFAASGVFKKGNGRASFHSLRATFISLMDEAGIQPYITDAITGHSNGGMHARYTQPSLEAMRSAVIRAIPTI